MTDKQINAAIAEACGWKEGVERHVQNLLLMKALPNYCCDLNAMHEAEKVLTAEQVREYQCYMYDMACEIDNTYGRWMPYSATARYRAEAFLKTLGKWEGGAGVSLIDDLRRVGRMGVADEDCLMLDAADRIEKLQAALERILDCDYPRSVDKMQQIAREALEKDTELNTELNTKESHV